MAAPHAARVLIALLLGPTARGVEAQVVVEPETCSGEVRKAGSAPGGCNATMVQYAEECLLLRLLKQNARIAPNPRPVIASVSATVTKVNEFSMKQQTFKLNMYFRHEWTDSRLPWKPADYCGTDRFLNLRNGDTWKPDTFFANANEESYVGGEDFLQLNYTGRLYWSRRIVLTFFCSMKFDNYPFDDQQCISRIESYGLPPTVLKYELAGESTAPDRRWATTLDLLDADGSQVDNAVVGSYFLSEPTAWLAESQVGGAVFSQVQFSFHFHRQATPYVVSVFFPLALVTGLSYLGLFINPAVPPARVGMAITTVLVLCTLMFTLTKDMPSTSYINGMDCLFLLCIGFVSMNCFEYVIVNYLNTAIAVNEDAILKRKKLRQATCDAGPTGELSPRTRRAVLADLEDVFRLFDRAGGVIDMNDLAGIFRGLASDRGMTLKPEKIDEYVHQADNDGSGTVDLKEFTDFVVDNPKMCAELGLAEPVAIVWGCGFAGVSKRTVRRVEATYRKVAAAAFVTSWVFWFVWNLSPLGTMGVWSYFFYVILANSACVIWGTVYGTWSGGRPLQGKELGGDRPPPSPYRPAYRPPDTAAAPAPLALPPAGGGSGSTFPPPARALTVSAPPPEPVQPAQAPQSLQARGVKAPASPGGGASVQGRGKTQLASYPVQTEMQASTVGSPNAGYTSLQPVETATLAASGATGLPKQASQRQPVPVQTVPPRRHRV